MAIECRRDLLRLDQPVGEETSQALVEGEIGVPETKASVAKILDISGEAIISGYEVIQDKVMVEGILRYDVLYMPEDDSSIDSVDAEIGFTQYLDIPGARPEMATRLSLNVEHVDFELLSGRKIKVKSVLDLYGQVSQVLEMEAVTDFSGIDDVEVLRDRIRVAYSAGSGRSQTMVREDLELSDSMPSILKIIRKSARARINEKKTADNKVLVHGDVALKLLYLCEDEDEPIQNISHNIPFSHVVEIPGTYQGMECRADVQVAEFYADPRENINNELRIIDTELVLAMEARIFEAQEGEILLDAYSPGSAMELKKKKIKLQQFEGESQGQTVVRESITFPEGVAKARKILYVDALPSITDERIDEGKVYLEGIISAQVLYQTNDPALPVGSFREDFPFSHVLEVEGVHSGMDCLSEVLVDQASGTLLAQDEAELKITILCRSSVFSTIEKDVITDADEAVQAEGREAGIYVYYVQPGDTLWSIAKKYNTTISAILKYNTQEGDTPVAGTRLLIYKRLDFPAV
ncbi:MAG: DUF3794 and LysM peptidoglycan-binding domain-containing protein [Caldicoprobacterales bacterium]|nr:DUF3794 domain-containing protein [Clostridiales bacterium]